MTFKSLPDEDGESIDTAWCNGPGCIASVLPGEVGEGWMSVLVVLPGNGRAMLHFHNWECARRYAQSQLPT